MLNDDAKAELCGGFVVKDRDDGSVVVYSPFYLDDGDNIGVRVERGDRGWLVSDRGQAIMRSSYGGINILNSKSRRKKLVAMVDGHGAVLKDGAICSSADEGELSEAVFRVLQAAIDVVRKGEPMANRHAAAKKFRRAVGHIVRDAVPSERIRHNWHDPAVDPRGVYPVDYAVVGKGEPWFVFGVNTDTKCLRATVACQHYQMFGKGYHGVVIYGDEPNVASRSKTQLDLVTEHHFSIKEADKAREFLQKAAA